MRRLLDNRLWLVVAVLYTIALLTVSLVKIKESALPVHFYNADKVFHFGAYLVLGLLWQIYYFLKYKSLKPKPCFWICSLAISFGIIIEILQKELTTYRGFEYFDILADALGVIAAWIILLALKNKLMSAYLGRNKKNT